MIYLDNAATTPMSAVAISAMTKVMQETHGNPSSIHGHGRQAGKLLREARQELAQLLVTKPQHIFFTSGGTEGNNTAIIGYCLRHQEQGKHIITTAIEHHAVLETIDYLVQHFGFEATIIQPENQEITAQQIQKALRDDTILVSTMFANNETGNLLPIAEIGQILKQHPAAYHVDAVQAIGKIPIHPEKLGIDFLTASAHKFHGPKGIGFLYASSMNFDSYLHGERLIRTDSFKRSEFAPYMASRTWLDCTMPAVQAEPVEIEMPAKSRRRSKRSFFWPGNPILRT